MSRILVVEDSPTQALSIQLMLEDAGHGVALASNGRKAIEALARNATDLVLTDLQMPEMDGLQLVREVRRRHPLIPVILMSAHGSEEIVAEALQLGAASYVPKRRMARDLIRTVGSVLSVASSARPRRRMLECWTRSESHFVLENDVSLIPALVAHLSENLARTEICDETGQIRVNVALSEALSNAIHHGNLELDSSLRETDESSYYGLARSRRTLPPFRDRRVYLIERQTANEVTYVIRDEGPGFDLKSVPDPDDPANLERPSGRGLLLIRTFMDEVAHNPTGNEITMVKRRDE